MTLSQDTLYNTAMSTCAHGTMRNWKYQSVFTTPSHEMASAFSIPANARIQCATISLNCDVKIEGPLSFFFDKIKSETQTVTCFRGSHLYSIIRVIHNPIVNNLTVFQDLKFSPENSDAHVSTNVSSSIMWPFGLYTKALEAKTADVMQDNARHYVAAICK
jgi:hypothetical protein